MATRIQITLTADSLSETTSDEFQDEFRRFTALHDEAPTLLPIARAALETLLSYGCPLDSAIIRNLKATIARAEGRS